MADTVGAPIEQQVTGVENMLYMSSQSGNDGSYSLSVTFDVGTNLNTALVMVQNRVMLAMPLLPTQVQNQGISIRKRTPDILMIVSLYSPDGRYDDLYLSNYAMINCRDEVLRVDGVSDVNIFGERDYSIRAWLDPQKMAALGINAGDVAAAIRSQNLDVPAGQVGAPPVAASQSLEIPIDALGRLSDAGAIRQHHRQGGPGHFGAHVHGGRQLPAKHVHHGRAGRGQSSASHCKHRRRDAKQGGHDGHRRPGQRLGQYGCCRLDHVGHDVRRRGGILWVGRRRRCARGSRRAEPGDRRTHRQFVGKRANDLDACVQRQDRGGRR